MHAGAPSSGRQDDKLTDTEARLYLLSTNKQCTLFKVCIFDVQTAISDEMQTKSANSMDIRQGTDDTESDAPTAAKRATEPAVSAIETPAQPNRNRLYSNYLHNNDSHWWPLCADVP